MSYHGGVTDGPVKMAPPPRKRARAQKTYTEILAECMDGDWWLIKRYDSSATAQTSAYELRPGHRRAHLVPPGRWEFQAGQVPDSDPPQFGVWARYLGAEEATA